MISYIKRITFFCAIFLVANCSLFSEQYANVHLDSFAYYYNSLQNEDSHFLSSEKSLYEKLLFVHEMHDILLDFLNTADDKNFYDQLKLSQLFIDRMTEVNNQIFSEIYQDRFCDRRPAIFNGMETYVYYNTFSKRRVLTDEERTALYNEEINRHKNVELLPKQFLHKEALKKLVSGQSYNFVITLDNKAYISYNQCYRLKNQAGKSLLNSPNHTMLAGNAPVLSAGVINYYRVGKKKLYVISSSSGHFHPMPDCLAHMKNYLMALGVPEEAIITYPVAYEKIDVQISKIKFASP